MVLEVRYSSTPKDSKDSKDVWTSLLPPNLDYVMNHFGGYNCEICLA